MEPLTQVKLLFYSLGLLGLFAIYGLLLAEVWKKNKERRIP